MTNKIYDCGLSTSLIYNMTFHEEIEKLPKKIWFLSLKKYYSHVVAGDCMS